MIDNLSIIISLQILGILTAMIFFRMRNAQKDQSIKYSLKELDFIIIFFIFLSLLYLASLGFPLLSSNVNYAKLSFNSNPIAARIVRLLIPCLLFVLVFRFGTGTLRYITVPAILLLTGFKGYLVTYFMLPIVYAMSVSGRSFNYRTLMLAGLMLCLLLFIISYIERVEIGLVFYFIFLRLTVSQNESLIVISDYFSKVSETNSIVTSFQAAASKFGLSNVKPLNHELFSLMHGDNPNNIQLAIPFVAEIYVSFGPIFAFFWVAVELYLLVIIISWFYKFRRSNLKLMINFMLYMTLSDIAFSGNAGIKLVDLLFSSIFLTVAYKTVQTIFRSLPKKVDEIENNKS